MEIKGIEVNNEPLQINILNKFSLSIISLNPIVEQ
jgi:hypothetical protein